jgi:ParB family transcriptional regulator, chromosome partitioning protein
MTRKPLGRGLGALLSAEDTNESAETQEVDPARIEPCPVQPRTRFDEASLKELADSIKANGVVQPLLVRRVGERFELVAGERRLRAAKLAGLAKVPVLIRDIPDEKLLEIALVENIQRESLNPIEEAQSYKKLIESVGLTQETLASRVGRDRSYITNYLRLLRLPDTVQTLVQDGRLSAGHARALLGFREPNGQADLARKIVKQGLSVRQTEELIRRAASEDEKEPAPRRAAIQSDPNVRALEVRLRRELGTQVRIIVKPGANQGVLQLDFYSLSDLDRLVERLSGAPAAHRTAGLL